MKLFPEGIAVVALAVVAGCGTIRAARETQERLASRGTPAEAASRVAPVVDLKGCPMRALVEFALANRPSMQSAVLDVQDARLALKEIASDAPIASATPSAIPSPRRARISPTWATRGAESRPARCRSTF